MAMYVAKNGEEFSLVVKSKKDPRFQFLESWHSHYPYYDFKRHLFQEVCILFIFWSYNGCLAINTTVYD